MKMTSCPVHDWHWNRQRLCLRSWKALGAGGRFGPISTASLFISIGFQVSTGATTAVRRAAVGDGGGAVSTGAAMMAALQVGHCSAESHARFLDQMARASLVGVG